MPIFFERSVTKLRTCDPLLVKLFLDVVGDFDCTVLCGHRGQLEQDELYYRGLSKLQFPSSRHNAKPSKAVDVAPYPINWNDKERFYYFAGFVKGRASVINLPIRWGGDWDDDTDLKDQTFIDLCHFELLDRRW